MLVYFSLFCNNKFIFIDIMVVVSLSFGIVIDFRGVILDFVIINE